MAESGAHLAKLVQLAHEPSSDTRRELLRDITDLFFDDEDARSGAAGDHADKILTHIADQMEESVRAELAERFADAEQAPAGLVRKLAADAISVSRPLLERSAALSDDALVEIAGKHGQDHLRAIARRRAVSETVSEVVVQRGDEDTLVAIASNEGARLSRGSMETLVDRAETANALHGPLVNREELPVDLLNEMFFFVGDQLRENIAERNDALDPAEIEAALEAARARLARRAPPPNSRYADAVRFIELKKLRKQLDGDLLMVLARDRRRAEFEVALAEMTGLDHAAVRRVVANPAVDPLAIACRAASFDRALFVKLAMLRETKGERESADAQVLGDIYDALPEDAAKRALRFWRMRRDAQETRSDAA